MPEVRNPFVAFLHDIGENLVDLAVDLLEELQGITTDDDEELEERTGFDYDVLAPVAIHGGRPPLPSAAWFYLVSRVAMDIRRNQAALEGEGSEQDHEVVRIAKQMERGEAIDPDRKLLDAVKALSRDGKRLFLHDMFQVATNRQGAKTPGTLAEYEALFARIALPAVAKTFLTDRSFAERRVAGPNPTCLERVHTLPASFPFTADHYRAVLPDDDLETARSEGRLYLLDYGGRQPRVSGAHPDRPKHAYEPIALFASHGGGLVPVAIQCGQDPVVYPIVLPSAGPTWKAAKTVVDVADANYHELVAHLGRTHLLVEPFVVITQGDLPETHPVRRLLTDHFEGTLFINWSAGNYLITPGSAVDILLSGTIDADRAAAVHEVSSRDFDASWLPTWLADQGLDDTDALPHFPFRDDAMLVWDAIHGWVTDFVDIHWTDDAAVRSDAHLQTWSRTLAAFDGGRVAGFGETPGGDLHTRAYLANALTMVIFTASAMHAAVNFPQRTVMSYAPAMPLAGYAPAPTGEITEEDWKAMLPGLDQALIQANILTLLGGVYYTRLGEYREGTFDEPREKLALEHFQEQLEAVEATIRERNRNGLRADAPYVHLLPSRLPASINI